MREEPFPAAAEPSVKPETFPAADVPAVRERPADPARAAARCLLDRAFSSAGFSIEDAARDGSVTLVIVPSGHWAYVVRKTWGDVARRGSVCCEGSTTSYNAEKVWTSFSPREMPRPTALEDHAQTLGKAVSKGLHVAGFSADQAWLPPDLLGAADYRITLPSLSEDDIRRVASELCGGKPTGRMTEAEIAAVTPKDLRLARRLGQTADQYIAKLQSLLSMASTERQISKSSDMSSAPTLERLHGMDDAVTWGMELAGDLEAHLLGKLPWSSLDHACLLSGRPGCGKTLFAKALAALLKVPLVTGTYGRWQGSGTGHQGDLLKAMSKTFAEARAAAPCVLLIDEIDSFPDRQSVHSYHADYMVQVVNAFLVEIDGATATEGLILVGTCNDPDRLDPAVVRSGRIDRHFHVRMPDRRALAGILREHLGCDLAGADLTQLSTAAVGSSGADCERYVRGARRRARVENREMAIADILREIEGDSPASAQDLWTAAVHEAGHAVAACVLHPGTLQEVCLLSRQDAGGQTIANLRRSRFLSASEMRAKVTFVLAGRASEEVIIGEPSSGAGGGPDSDLSRATNLALRAFASLGLDEGNGLVWRGVHDIRALPQALERNPAAAQRIRAYLDDAYRGARDLILGHKPAVLMIAKMLLEKRVVDGTAAEEIISVHAAAVPVTTASS